ncbi:hypothetical protein ACN28S_34850 [Cystobacter fuscus]
MRAPPRALALRTSSVRPTRARRPPSSSSAISPRVAFTPQPYTHTSGGGSLGAMGSTSTRRSSGSVRRWDSGASCVSGSITGSPSGSATDTWA